MNPFREWKKYYKEWTHDYKGCGHEHKEWGYYDYDYYYDVGWGGVGVGTSTTHFNERQYELGTLACDVFSSESKNLIWQGIVEGTLDANPKSNDTGIPKAVAAIMAKFPVEAK